MLKDYNLNLLADNIVYFQDKFREFGVFLYPMFGTLLGIVREQDFISHDSDVDLCWHAEGDREQVLRRVLEVQRECHLAGIFGFPHTPLGKFKVLKDGLYNDVSVSWDEGTYHNCVYGDYGEKYDMTPIAGELRGRKILIPKDADKILDATYIDWQISITRDKEYRKFKRGHYL